MQTDGQTETESGDPTSDALRILDEMPQVQEHAIASVSDPEDSAESAAPAAAPAHVFAELDAAGEAWNSEIHATGRDGKGVKTATGLWRRRRGVGGGRRASIVSAPTGAGNPPLDATASQARAAGVACAHTLFTMGRALGGEEWAPRQNAEVNEVAMMEKAWGDYFVAKNLTDFPPGLALSIACASYALPRFTMPNTQARLTRLKQWAASKWIAWKDRKKPKHTRDIGKGAP